MLLRTCYQVFNFANTNLAQYKFENKLTINEEVTAESADSKGINLSFGKMNHFVHILLITVYRSC